MAKIPNILDLGLSIGYGVINLAKFKIIQSYYYDE